MGANGILHAELDEPSSGAKIAAAYHGGDTTRRDEMIAIFVKKFEKSIKPRCLL